jgi:hypothetical protein
MNPGSLCTGLQNIDAVAENLNILGIDSAQGRVLAYIETTLSHTIQEIQVRPHGCPSITLKRIKDVKASVNVVTQQVERRILDREVTYCFPGKNKDEAWRFGQ